MGQLRYGSPPEVFELDDRTLAHVEIVLLAKLRRNENFAVSLDVPGGGRSTVWIGSNTILHFKFDSARHDINKAWLEELIDSANTPAGMRIVPEGVAASSRIA